MKKLFRSLWILLGFLMIEEMANGQQENIALWGKSSQSSTYAGSHSKLAVDGKPTTWTHTNTQSDPWWRVDLLKVYKVNRVTITNRPQYAYRINGAVIRIGNFLDVYSNTICGVISTLGDGATATFSCGGMEGRYVVVHIPGDPKILSLTEVGVYGYLAGPVFKRSFVKMQFKSRKDLTDPSTGESILKQLGSALADRGFTNMTLYWTQTPKCEVMQKDTAISPCGEEK